MKARYDPDAKALYVTVRDSYSVLKTDELVPGSVNIDYAGPEATTIVGVEFLGVELEARATTYYGTLSLQSEAILAAQDTNLVELARILEKMEPAERRRLHTAAVALGLNIERYERGELSTRREP